MDKILVDIVNNDETKKYYSTNIYNRKHFDVSISSVKKKNYISTHYIR